MQKLCVLVLYFYISATTLFTPTDGRAYSRRLRFQVYKSGENSPSQSIRKLKLLSHLGFDPRLNPFANEAEEAYAVNSPFSLPPFNSLSPRPLPSYTPPYCINAPPPPLRPIQSPPPVNGLSPPPVNGLSPPPSNGLSPPPANELSPPPANGLSPPPANGLSPSPANGLSPPPENGLNPPISSPNPPHYGPNPAKHGPSPPMVYPPPISVPPPPAAAHRRKPENAVWCVAKPTVPDPIIQEAMDYACGSGADCKSIQTNGSCFQPDTILSHASYAFNSYWQSTKLGGGTCDFGGTAMLVTVDPSFDECSFSFN